jgi:hypothetical protein
MYLAMTQSDFEEVIEEAPLIVAKRLGLADDLERAQLRAEIIKIDPLAAGLLEKFIEVYTEWWTTSSAAIQGEPGSIESAHNIQRLIDKRGRMRSALMNYLNSQYPADARDHPSSPGKHSSGPHGKVNRFWKQSIIRAPGSAPGDAINEAEA